jgi:thiosulfate dehydrogenase [quinone] large subunit
VISNKAGANVHEGDDPKMSNIAEFNRAGATRGDDGAPTASFGVVLVGLRLFLAVGWMRAAVEKVIDSRWWDGLILDNFLRAQRPQALPFFRPIMDHLISPRLVVVSVAVVVAQIVCSLLILTGRWLRPALIVAVVMNLTFVFAGRVNPSAFYLVMEFTLLIAIADGVIGPAGRRSTRSLAACSVALIVAAVALTPFVETLDPAEVITDPAIVLAVVLAIAGVVFGLLAHTGRDAADVERRVSPWFAWWITAGRVGLPGAQGVAAPHAVDASNWLPPSAGFAPPDVSGGARERP